MENSEEVQQMLKNPHRIRKLRKSKFAVFFVGSRAGRSRCRMGKLRFRDFVDLVIGCENFHTQ